MRESVNAPQDDRLTVGRVAQAARSHSFTISNVKLPVFAAPSISTGATIGDVGPPGYDWEPVPNPVPDPFGALCAVRRDVSGADEHRGTASLVTRKALITAAHVVDVGQPRKSKAHYWLLKPSAFFAIRAKNLRYNLGSEWVSHIAVPVETPILGTPTDIAVLIMTTPALDDLRPLIPVPFNKMGSHKLVVAGYPKHWDQQIADGNKILTGTGPGGINPAVGSELVYQIDTFEGHSGGPVFLQSDPSSFIGIHVDEADGIHNTGLRFTPTHLGWAAHVISDLTQ